MPETTRPAKTCFELADPPGRDRTIGLSARQHWMKAQMSQGTLVIEQTDPASTEAIELMRQLTAELTARYDFLDDGTGNFLPEESTGPGGAFLIGRVEGKAVACAALRRMAADIGEVKRVYVTPSFRGRGYGSRLIAAIERVADECGYHTLRLETGVRQPESLVLYERSGYQRIPNYEPYADSHWSVCFEKSLGAGAVANKLFQGSTGCARGAGRGPSAP